MKALTGRAAFWGCITALSFAMMGQVRAGDDFENSMRAVFADDGWADVRITFGYDNYKEYENPSDPARARRFMKYLVDQKFRPVVTTQTMADALGVPLDAQNLRIFDGRTASGQMIRVSFIWSAATSSTEKNLGSENARQVRCSNEALSFMQRSAASSEVMMYVGHSRSGGGPDTFPPRIVPGTDKEKQKVDFPYYRRNRPGLAALAPSFRNSSDTPDIIAWTGCQSETHFKDWFVELLGNKSHPTCMVLSTRLIRHKPWEEDIEGCDENLMVVLRTLEALLHHQSRDTYEHQLKWCEIDEYRKPSKPAWKLSIIPGVRQMVVEPQIYADHRTR